MKGEKSNQSLWKDDFFPACDLPVELPEYATVGLAMQPCLSTPTISSPVTCTHVYTHACTHRHTLLSSLTVQIAPSFSNTQI